MNISIDHLLEAVNFLLWISKLSKLFMNYTFLNVCRFVFIFECVCLQDFIWIHINLNKVYDACYKV